MCTSSIGDGDSPTTAAGGEDLWEGSVLRPPVVSAARRHPRRGGTCAASEDESSSSSTTTTGGGGIGGGSSLSSSSSGDVSGPRGPDGRRAPSPSLTRWMVQLAGLGDVDGEEESRTGRCGGVGARDGNDGDDRSDPRGWRRRRRRRLEGVGHTCHARVLLYANSSRHDDRGGRRVVDASGTDREAVECGGGVVEDDPSTPTIPPPTLLDVVATVVAEVRERLAGSDDDEGPVDACEGGAGACADADGGPGGDRARAVELLALGSVWILPSPSPPRSTETTLTTTGGDVGKRRRRKKNGALRPRRASSADADLRIPPACSPHHEPRPASEAVGSKTAIVAARGPVVRVHHSPPRFPSADMYDWGAPYSTSGCGGGSDGDALVVVGGREVSPPPARRRLDENVGGREEKPGVILHEDLLMGYAVLAKPPGVPVHATVYNDSENVAARYGRALAERRRRNGDDTEEGEEVHVTLPQRLDNDTSGVLVVATSRPFASYMCKLLESKTAGSTMTKSSVSSSSSTSSPPHHSPLLGPVTKRYRCLVRVGGDDDDGSSSSSASEAARLEALAGRGTGVVTHYLDPRRSMPRNYVERIPPGEEVRAGGGDDDASPWLPCHLRLSSVGEVTPVRGSPSSRRLARRLWGSDVEETRAAAMGYGNVVGGDGGDGGDDGSSDFIASPAGVGAVAEVEVELLTGRPHQIRGQLSALGFPIVNDTLYGGGGMGGGRCGDSSLNDENDGDDENNRGCRGIALQCCELSFPHPDWGEGGREGRKLVASDRMNTFRLHRAWWTDIFEATKPT